MLCNICHKDTATVHLTEIVDEKVVELHVCQRCAQSKKGLIQEHFDFSGLVGAFADEGDDKGGPQLKCANCGLDYQKFKKIGRLGCKDCYLAFKALILPLLKRVHGSARHQGKFPVSEKSKMPVESRLNRLKEELKKSVEAEEYEVAASLRDQIKKLEEESGP